MLAPVLARLQAVPGVASARVDSSGRFFWIARAAGQRACQQAGAQFLDDTVEIARLRLRRDARGRFVLYREYRLEFTRNHDYRLRGEIAMLVPRVVRLALAP